MHALQSASGCTAFPRLAGLNVSFAAHPSAYVVHVPHRRSLANRLTKATGLWEALHALYARNERDMRRRRFVPVVSFPLHLCALQSRAVASHSDSGGSTGSGE